MYGSDTILPLERLQSTVHCIQPSRASPTDGSPSNLPLERLQSAGDESLERFQPLFFTGVTPVRLLDTTDTMCSKSPCHQPYSVSEQRLDTQDHFFVKPAGPDCLRSVE